MKAQTLRARHYASRLKLKPIADAIGEKTFSESTIELIYKYGENSYVFIFHFGSVVFVDIPEGVEARFAKLIQETAGGTQATVTEDFLVEEDQTLPQEAFHDTGFNKVKVQKLTFPVLRLLVLVVAESAALETYETTAEDLLNKSRRISRDLQRTGKTKMSMNKMVKFVGDCMNTKQEIITDLYVVDAPDETWDDQILDRLYADTKRLFEVETRYKVLEFKLKLVQETVDVVVEILRFKRQSILELIIIALIAVEIIWLVMVPTH